MSMNAVWMWILLAVIVIGGGGWFAYSRMNADTTQVPVSENTSETTSDGSDVPATAAEQTAAPAGKGSGSLGSIYSRSGNYTCTFETLNSSVKTRGTIYVSGGKTRSDLSTSAVGITTEVHNILNGGYSYTWIAGQPTGTKTYVGTSKAAPANSTGAGFEGDLNSQISWDCHPWLTDAAQFSVPSTIKFVAQ